MVNLRINGKYRDFEPKGLAQLLHRLCDTDFINKAGLYTDIRFGNRTDVRMRKTLYNGQLFRYDMTLRGRGDITQSLVERMGDPRKERLEICDQESPLKVVLELDYNKERVVAGVYNSAGNRKGPKSILPTEVSKLETYVRNAFTSK